LSTDRLAWGGFDLDSSSATARLPGPVVSGANELRNHYGPGYRIYCQQRGVTLVVQLAGGDKGSQAAGIKMAKRLAAEHVP